MPTTQWRLTKSPLRDSANDATLALSQRNTVPCQDTHREAVHVPSGDWKEALPDARRGSGLRRSNGGRVTAAIGTADSRQRLWQRNGSCGPGCGSRASAPSLFVSPASDRDADRLGCHAKRIRNFPPVALDKRTHALRRCWCYRRLRWCPATLALKVTDRILPAYCGLPARVGECSSNEWRGAAAVSLASVPRWPWPRKAPLQEMFPG